MTYNKFEQNEKNDQNYENYYHSKNFKYFDFNYDKHDDNTKVIVSLIIKFKFTCRKCKFTLKFNNAFYKHLKICVKINKINSSSVSTHVNITSISMKNSIVNANKNIDTDYDFRKFQCVDENFFNER